MNYFTVGPIIYLQVYLVRLSLCRVSRHETTKWALTVRCFARAHVSSVLAENQIFVLRGPCERYHRERLFGRFVTSDDSRGL